LRTAVRLVRAASVMLAGVGLAAVGPVLRDMVRERAVRTWFRWLLAAFGVRFEVYGPQRFTPDVLGAPHQRTGVLVVANHSSWLDILALNAVQPLRMVAKKEISDWAFVGTLASRAGTIYVDRERLLTLPRTVADLTGALRAGSAVGVFPEGTTWCGLASGRYRPAPFQAAVDAGVPVRPVALRYRRRDGVPTTTAAFVGDASLWNALCRVAAARGLVVEVHVLPELTLGPAPDRRALAMAAEAAVTAMQGTVRGDSEEPHRVLRVTSAA
jgi:1-acyl-sn-glycerol-3-phosphate acyltransferase